MKEEQANVELGLATVRWKREEEKEGKKRKGRRRRSRRPERQIHSRSSIHSFIHPTNHSLPLPPSVEDEMGPSVPAKAVFHGRDMPANMNHDEFYFHRAEDYARISCISRGAGHEVGMILLLLIAQGQGRRGYASQSER
ncbi:hypothetical protein VTL71DRAFT_1948 [Oculimacula yallundae]|uniref:Uncharacterized protein n=1 Tax=Oculimacula yallundae TaxID=86028 RepID=A0ABR4CEJ2_9HELO